MGEDVKTNLKLINGYEEAKKENLIQINLNNLLIFY